MDVSAFDFSPAELIELFVAFATVAEAFEIEPRLHQKDEQARTGEGIIKMHEGLTDSTFRVRCRLRAADNVIRQFAALESALGVCSVLDRDGSVRIHHDRGGVVSN
ncbi:MAG TPA: hypothetical protein VNE42_04700 [Acidimicrobiales bacterium]|nr:hypothetical protein [Acidimicrobiales bacterium]